MSIRSRVALSVTAPLLILLLVSIMSLLALKDSSVALSNLNKSTERIEQTTQVKRAVQDDFLTTLNYIKSGSIKPNVGLARLTNSRNKFAPVWDDFLTTIESEGVDNVEVYKAGKLHLDNGLDELMGILSKQDTVTKLEIQSEKYFKEIEEQPIIDKKLKKLNRLHNTISEKQKRIETEVDFFNDNEECPTCEQHIDSDFKTKAIEVRTKKLQEYINGLKDIDKDIDTNEKELNTIINISEKIKSNDVEIGKLTSSIEELENFNTEYENEVKDLTDKDVTEKQLNELTSLQESLVSLGKRKAEMIEDKHYNDVVRNMLQDTGIKTKIVKRYLPVMNKLINGYLSSMDFFINFTIDENFNEVIKSRYRDEFKYYSFSEGEKMRIDLALLFTWRAIAKMKNSTNTNLLLLDEIFDSSLDGTGTDDFLKILNTFQKENVFVISHKGDVLYDKFAHILKFEKIQNFSKTIDVA